MKLTFQADLPSERLVLLLPGSLARDLKLFQQYLAATQGQQKDLKQLATTILEAFLAGGDRQFLAWRRAQDGKGNGALKAGPAEGKASVRSASTSGVRSDL